MSILVEQSGVLTTVQDLGRMGYQRFGMPAAGAVDPRSLALANLLVGNEEAEGALECTILGPTLLFEEETVFSITGGDLGAMLDGKSCPRYRAVRAAAGSRLRFSGLKNGCRGYIAFAGGLAVPKLMGSYSTYRKAALGGFQGRELQKGDRLELRGPESPLRRLGSRVLGPDFVPQKEYTLHVILGPQDDCFTETGLQSFLNESYSVTSDFDRMGCRLEGPSIEHRNGADIISDGIAFGAVQVPSSGKPIIMLADRQTTGGYTKIAGVISADFRLLGQLKGGDRVRFQAVTREYAQALRHMERQYIGTVREFMDRIQKE